MARDPNPRNTIIAFMLVLVAAALAGMVSPVLAADAVQKQDTNVSGVVAELVECKREDGTLTIRMRLVNTADKEVSVTAINGRNFDAYYVTAANKKYFILRDSEKTPLAAMVAAMACGNVSAQAPPGKVLLLESKVLGIVGVSLGLDAKLKDLGAKVVGNEIVIERAADVLFDFDKHAIKPAAVPSLAKVAAVLNDLGKAPATVEGHTDAKGDESYNHKLSDRRATAVKDWLVKEGGITSNRLSAKGFGKSKPVAPNAKQDGRDDPEGRQKNRRVEIRVRKG